MGFKLNTHDQCVRNKMIEGTKCTIVWFVEENKMTRFLLKSRKKWENDSETCERTRLHRNEHYIHGGQHVNNSIA